MSPQEIQVCSHCGGSGYIDIDSDSEHFQSQLRFWALISGTVFLTLYCVVRIIHGHYEISGWVIAILCAYMAFLEKRKIEKLLFFPSMIPLASGEIPTPVFNTMVGEVGLPAAIYLCELILLIRSGVEVPTVTACSEHPTTGEAQDPS